MLQGDGYFGTDADPARDDGMPAEICDLDSINAYFIKEMADGPGPETVRCLTDKAQELERSVILLRHQKSGIPA